MFDKSSAEAGVEQSSGYELRRGECRGPRSCFYISPFRRGRHDGATGMDPTPRSVRRCLTDCLFSSPGSKQEHLYGSTRDVIVRGCQEADTCPRNHIQMRIDHYTCSTTTRVYTCHIASWPAVSSINRMPSILISQALHRCL